MTDDPLRKQLSAMVDEHGIAAVIECLSNIAQAEGNNPCRRGRELKEQADWFRTAKLLDAVWYGTPSTLGWKDPRV